MPENLTGCIYLIDKQLARLHFTQQVSYKNIVNKFDLLGFGGLHHYGRNQEKLGRSIAEAWEIMLSKVGLALTYP